MSDLIERLRAPDWHDPKCPFQNYCYCGDDENPSPHDKTRHPDAMEAADRIEALEAAIIAALREPDDNMRPILRAALHEEGGK